MKNAFKVSTGIVVLFSSMSVFAEGNSEHRTEQELEPKPNNNVANKITPVYEGHANLMISILEDDFPTISARFIAAFPGATKQLWIKEGKLLFAYFRINETKISAVFSEKGHMQYAVSILDEKDIPENLLLQLRNEYPQFSISKAKAIQAGGCITYEMIIENSFEYITVSFNDESEIEQINRIRKTTFPRNS